ncbi:TonB-dependent receptor [soil metagenome]
MARGIMKSTQGDTNPAGPTRRQAKSNLRGLLRSSGVAATFAVAGVTAACLTTTAHAQSAPAAQQNGASATVQEIIVTAQRREESLSKVPLSVSAIGAEALQQRVVQHEQDLASLVPGLVVKNGQNQNQVSFTLRGQTLDPFSGASPAVLTYLNEVPFGQGNSSTSFYDFSSIQVLKGPQGTLFGRNATGGAVLYSSVQPGDEFGGTLTVRAGERNLVEVQGGVDLPLVPEKLTVRVAGVYQKLDGYVHNRLAGGTLGNVDNKSGRITLVFKPTESIKNVTVFQYSKFGGNESASALYSYYKMGQTNNGYALTTTLDTVYGNGLFPGVGDGPAGPGTFPGAVAGYLAFQKAHPYDIYLSYDLPHHADNTFLSNTTTIDLGSDLVFKNIFGYQKSYAKTPGILSGSPFASLDLYNSTGAFAGPPGGEVFKNDSISEEAQLQGTTLSNNLTYIFGGFYNYSTNDTGIPVIVGGELASPLGQVLYHTRGTDRSRAVYGQGTYNLSSWLQGLSFTGGARYTWETVGMTPYADHVFASGFPKEKKTLKRPSWNLNLQWQFSPNSQVYAAQRGSFRSGNFNGAVVPYNLTNYFKNELAHDFEVGYKFSGEVSDRPVHFNVAVYDQIVKDAQHSIYAVVAGAPSAFTVNVPEATVKGVETDGDLQANDWLKLGFSLAYTKAEYTKNQVDLSTQTGVPGTVIPFDSYPDAPRWAGSLYVDVTLPTPAQWGEMHLRADAFKQTYSYFSNNNGTLTPGTKLPGYTTVAARFSWEDIMGSKVSAAIYAKNIFDKVYYQSGYVEGNSGGFNTAIVGEPRTIAAEISAKF